MNLTHIESRRAKETKDGLEFFVDCDNTGAGFEDVVNDLKKQTTHLQVLSPDSRQQEDGRQEGMAVSHTVK